MPAKILIVDDEVIVAESMRVVLRQMGYAVSAAVNSPEAALAALERERPDLVLMDINLGADEVGIATAETIRTRYNLPVVYVTACSDETTLSHAKTTHPFGYITKPFEGYNLRIAIEIALHNHTLDQRLQRSEQALAEQAETHRALLSTTLDGIVETDEDGRILEANQAHCRLLGYTHSELTALRVLDLDATLTPAEVALTTERIRREGNARFETRHRAKDGRLIDVDVSITCVPSRRRFVAFCRDISERRQIEAVLRESEQRYRVLFESSRDAIMTLEPPSWRFTTGNPATVKLFGAKDEPEFVSRGPWQLSPDRQPDGRESAGKAREMIETAMRNGSHLFEWTHRRISGEEFPATVLLSRMQSAGTVFLQATVRDISEQKRAEAALQLEKSLFDSLVNTIPDRIYFKDRQSRFFRVNNQVAQLCGLRDPAEAIGKTDADFFAAVHAQQTYKEEQHLMRTGEPLINLEEKEIWPDGRVTWVSSSKVPLRDGDGNITGLVGISRDITQRKETEQKLRVAEEKFETVFREAPVWISISDLADGTYIDVNEEAFRRSGYSREEIIGRPANEVPWLNTRARVRLVREIQKHGRVAGLEVTYRAKDGRALHGLLNGELTTIGGRRCLLTVSTDITERKQAEGRLLQAKAALQETNARLEVALARARELAHEAEAASRAKSAFLTSMSHELRTPLNVINGVAATLIEQHADSDQKKSLQLVLESGENLLGIIEEILDYSGLQAGQPRIETKPFDLLGVVAQVLRMAGEAARRKRLDLGFSVAACLPACVVSDPRRLQQVLLNLINNAIKFTDHGRVHLHCSARPGPPGRWRLSFAVSDTGHGLAPADRARLFQPFIRGSGAGVAQKSGSGLGLVISRAYVNLLGGDIVVRSRPGRGSVFRCTIEAGDADSRATALAAIAPAGLRNRPTLIVIDDHRQRRFLAATARAWGLPATVCSGSGATAAALQAAGPFAAAILDPEAMRDQSRDLVRWLAAAGRTVPVAWLHRFDPPPRPETAGPSATLPHPLDLIELARALANLTAKSPALSSAGSGSTHQAKLGERIPLRILAADDIRTNREMLRMMINHLGYKLTTVENGAEVLAAMQQQPFDLILLDIQMPVMDGHAAAREICRLQPDPALRPKMVAITANALPGDREKCLAAGMDDYLSKPVLPRNIEACIVRLFQSRSPTPAEATAPREAAPPEAPWVDRAHLESAMPGFTPAQSIEMLRHLHVAAGADFQQIWPQVAAACQQKDSRRLAELAHGLKGCFLMLGWTRIAGRCIAVLGQTRKGEFTEWENFPTELKYLFGTSSTAMDDYLATVAPAPSGAGNSLPPANPSVVAPRNLAPAEPDSCKRAPTFE